MNQLITVLDNLWYAAFAKELINLGDRILKLQPNKSIEQEIKLLKEFIHGL
jgi:hypothetical protein